MATLIRARYPKIPRRVSGYNLDELLPENGFNVARALVGSEGTCVAVLEATLRLVPSPPCRALTVIGFADVYTRRRRGAGGAGASSDRARGDRPGADRLHEGRSTCAPRT
jgi:FAD/FMN-containing dehydrogenase